jgi:membrane protease YdiL (CAAX protease family)
VSPIDPISQPEAGSPETGPPEAVFPEAGSTIEPTVPLPITAEPPPLVTVPVSTEIDLLDLFLVGVMTITSFLFLGGLAAVIFMMAHRAQHLNSKAMEDALTGNAFFVVPTQFVIYMVILGFMAFLVWVRHKTSLFQAVHWNAPNRKRAMYALLIGAGLAIVSVIAEAVLNRWIPKSLPIAEFFKDRPSALLLAVFAVLVAPFMEEMFFRGFFYPAVARWTGPALSILVTASLFTLLHGSQLGYSWAALLPIFFVGVVLTVTRAATKSVATCVIVHMAYNFVLLAQSYVASNGFRQMQGS